MSPEERARYIRELVDNFPPLTEQQLNLIASMMQPVEPAGNAKPVEKRAA